MDDRAVCMMQDDLIPPTRTRTHAHRAAYSMSRLQLSDGGFLAAVAHHTTGRLSASPPEALSGLAVGLALGGHQPSEVRVVVVVIWVWWDGCGECHLPRLPDQ